MTTKIIVLQNILKNLFVELFQDLIIAFDEITMVVKPLEYLNIMRILRDHTDTSFDELIDLCGVDYSMYKDNVWDGPRFAVVSHLLSIQHNWRLRVKVFTDDNFPLVPSITNIWNAANWYEREAFDLFGILFDGHDDLRRILTDYGFIGHPFRKDFPISGYVEMRYDAEQQRVIYEPITIEPREITPRIIREENYGIKD